MPSSPETYFYKENLKLIVKIEFYNEINNNYIPSLAKKMLLECSANGYSRICNTILDVHSSIKFYQYII